MEVQPITTIDDESFRKQVNALDDVNIFLVGCGIPSTRENSLRNALLEAHRLYVQGCQKLIIANSNENELTTIPLARIFELWTHMGLRTVGN